MRDKQSAATSQSIAVGSSALVELSRFAAAVGIRRVAFIRFACRAIVLPSVHGGQAVRGVCVKATLTPPRAGFPGAGNSHRRCVMTSILQRVAEDLRLLGYMDVTCEEYLRRIKHFVDHHGERAPETLSADDVRSYMLHLADDLSNGPANRKTTVAALKFLYNTTLNLPEVVARLRFPKVPLTLLDIPSPGEVAAVLSELESPVYRTLLFCAYAAGLRVSEACNLCVGDIDSKRMVITVRSGKGGRDRYAMLSPVLLDILRKYYAQYRPPQPYLFQGKYPGRPVPVQGVQTALRMALQRSGVSKRVTPHTLRHAFATHSLESGTNLRVIQTLLGHANIRSTMRYLHVSTQLISKTKSPFDAIVPEIKPPSPSKR